MSEESIRAHERGMRLSAMSMPQVTTLQLVHHAKRGVLRVGMFFHRQAGSVNFLDSNGKPCPAQMVRFVERFVDLGGQRAMICLVLLN